MKIWDDFLAGLEQEIGADTVSRWLRPLKVEKFDAANLHLVAQDSFQVDWFEEHIRPRIDRGQLVNNNFRPIHVHLTWNANAPTLEKKVPSSFFQSDALNPDQNLQSFLVEPENQMAYQIMADVEKKAFNPIFLYGPRGSGKTHLLMGAAWILAQSGQKVFYTTAQTFTEHVVMAMRQQRMQEFRKVYRDIDVLIIEDIEVLKGKTATQEEFFHTFNTLHMAGRTILLSSANPPAKLEEIEPRLISRFEWGISIGMQPIDTKKALQKKAALWKWDLSSEIIDWLAETFREDLWSAFHALALRKKGLLHLEGAKLLLQDFKKKEALTPEKIIKAMATHHGIKPEDILGKSQVKEFVIPRKKAMYLCREKLKLPFQKIGEIFHRDHSTVIASIEWVKKQPPEYIDLKF
ncbi:MAG: ATP-binding protein [Chlamydiia bacterium]|nr:ATP-binding protein [Chlamydiia bacterium]